MLNENIKSCLLCGVGGQGTVLASRIIAAAAMARGLSARTAETIGMAQRGGSVVSHVRTGMNIASPMIPAGKADVIIGFEPGEAAKNLKYLKKDGIMILCGQEVRPVTASLGDSDYDGMKSIAYLKDKVKKCFIIDAGAICAECGSPKVLNVAVVGALCASGAMDITIEEVKNAIRSKMKPELVAMNEEALYLGENAIKECEAASML